MQIQNLRPGAHIHLMGICGTAMASLAGLLKERGYKITGSDSNPYPPMSTQLEQLGIQIQKPYAAENLQPQPDFVIVGNVISANNPEAVELMRLKIPYASLPQALGEVIIEDRESIVISGTHGKTTTTSLMAWVAMELGLQPGFLIGGIPKNFAKSFQNPKGKYFVIEGDEYDTAFFDKVPKFIHYRPRHVILTSVEFDHADIYKDLNAVKKAFQRLVELIPQSGTLVYYAEDGNVAELAGKAQVAQKASYGLNQGEYRVQVLSTTEKGTAFRVTQRGMAVGEFSCSMAGDYNILNCTAVITLCHRLGWDMAKVKAAIASFTGVKRRQEILGEPNGVLIIEDFAHHPTAVRETLRGIRERYKGRKIIAVFEPRSATSRRKVFQKDYVEALALADEVLVMRAFDQAKIDEGDRFSSDELIADIFRVGRPAKAFQSADDIVRTLAKTTRPGDLVLIMSNGGFDGIYDKLLKALDKVAVDSVKTT